MPIVAHARPYVIGVDSHARSHTLAVLACPTGQVLDQATFPATTAGLNRAITWVARRTGDDMQSLWVIEGIGSYGARLARAATDHGYTVAEAPRMNARAHRATGKSDPLDAHRIAAATLPLALDQLRTPRADDGARAALAVLLTSRDHLITQRTATINALTALLRSLDLGIDARRPLSATQIGTIATWRPRHEDLATATTRGEAIRYATRIKALNIEITEITTTITRLLTDTPAAALLTMPGIGPITAAITFVVWSHLGRVRSEAAFAALVGVNPIPASSGNTTRHRLNRGGDRRANRALHMAVLTLIRTDPETQAYLARRTAQGKTPREIRRSLKRYLARRIYHRLNTTARTQTTPTAA